MFKFLKSIQRFFYLSCKAPLGRWRVIDFDLRELDSILIGDYANFDEAMKISQDLNAKHKGILTYQVYNDTGQKI